MSTDRQEVEGGARADDRGSQGGTIVIVGAGQAGGWAAQTLRKEGYGGRIVLLGDEPHIPYERPPLSKAVLAGTAAPASTALLKPQAFEALQLDWRPGISARRIDRATRSIELDDGERIAYDKLILCTGGQARALGLGEESMPGVYRLRSIADAQALAADLRPGTTIAIVGGGWIGLEVAATARGKGAEVVVLEAQSRLCERTVPAALSAMLQRLHEARGVRIELNAGVQKLESGTQRRLQLGLANGDTLECDAVVVGVGLVPNDALARDAGLHCEGGIVVDGACRSSDPDILAAGDVAVAANPWAGRALRLESWQNAQDQGIAAARAALGLEVDYKPLPWFWSDQYDVNLQIVGFPGPRHHEVLRPLAGANSAIRFYLEGGVVQAAVATNAPRELRFAKRLIEQRKPVSPAALADPAVPLAKL